MGKFKSIKRVYRRGDNLKVFGLLPEKAKTRIWSWSSCVCHIRSTAARQNPNWLHRTEITQEGGHHLRERNFLERNGIAQHMTFNIKEAHTIAAERRRNNLKRFSGLEPESQGHYLTLTALCVLTLLDSGQGSTLNLPQQLVFEAHPQGLLGLLHCRKQSPGFLSKANGV